MISSTSSKGDLAIAFGKMAMQSLSSLLHI